MLKIYLNQKKNNIFFNIKNHKKNNIFYNSIGLEDFKSKKLSFPVIDFLINKMFFFLNNYIKKNYFIFNKKIYLREKKIFIFIYIDVVGNFSDFIISIINNFYSNLFKFNRIIFLNNNKHGGCKFKKKLFGKV